MPADDSDNEDVLEIVTEPEEEENENRFERMEEGYYFFSCCFSYIHLQFRSSDDEDHFPDFGKMQYRKFGQENILEERETHTPPSCWALADQETRYMWPEPGDTRLVF